MTINIIQGDSSDTYTFESSDIGTFDANWSSKYAIVPALGETAVLSGTLQKNVETVDALADTQFILSLLPYQTQSLAVGNYILCVEITQVADPNASPVLVTYRKEVMQERLVIKKQGVA